MLPVAVQGHVSGRSDSVRTLSGAHPHQGVVRVYLPHAARVPPADPPRIPGHVHRMQLTRMCRLASPPTATTFPLARRLTGRRSGRRRVRSAGSRRDTSSSPTRDRREASGQGGPAQARSLSPGSQTLSSQRRPLGVVSRSASPPPVTFIFQSTHRGHGRYLGDDASSPPAAPTRIGAGSGQRRSIRRPGCGAWPVTRAIRSIATSRNLR